MAHFLLLTIGSGGDLYPFLRMGKVLIADGHTVTMASHCVYEAEARSNGFAFLPLDTPERYSLLMNAEIQVKVQDPKSGVDYFKTYMLPQLETLTERTMAACDAQTVIIGHYMVHGLAQLLAEKLKLIYITVFLAPSFMESAATAEQTMRYVAREFNLVRAKVGLPSIHNWHEAMSCYHHGIAFWPEWFGNVASVDRARISFAGFLLHENKENIGVELQQWLAENKPVLITHGTTPPLSSSFFTSCIEACSELNYCGIVVAKRQHVSFERLSPGLRYMEFIPFSKVMSNISVLCHHGGIGTLAQALYSGVPQLILGNGFDRPLNASYVQSLGAGEFVPMPQWNKQRVAELLQRLKERPEVSKNSAAVSARMRQSDVEGNLIHIVRNVLAASRPMDYSALYEASIPSDRTVRLRENIQKLTPEQRNRLGERLGL